MIAINFTNDQQKALEMFDIFLSSEDEAMILTGGAGTGKTTLMKYMLETMDRRQAICGLMGKDPITRIALTATTNKAAEVLMKAVGQEVKTIHSFMRLQVYNDYSDGTTKITKRRDFEIITDTIIFVDECSMVDRELMKILREGTRNCKIVFIGDHCQLAPVAEPISQVFTSGFDIARLVEIVRSKGAPPITDLCLQLRETVETGVFCPIDPVPGYIEYLDPTEMQQKLQEYFLYSLAPEARVMAWRNSQVTDYNTYLRHERNLPPLFTAGESVVSNTATMIFTIGGASTKSLTRIEQEIMILRADEPEPDEYIKSEYGYDLMVYKVWISSTYFVYQPVDPAQVQKVISNAKKNKIWDLYFHCREEMADLRSKDACTVYKSQGSTYHTAFVDLADIGRCNIESQVSRMLYVACSRPTHRIFLYGQLPAKYGGRT